VETQVTKLAPQPAHVGLAFDKFRYIDPQLAVDVIKTRTGFQSTGIDFADYGGMHTFRPSQLTAPRQTSIPEWACDDSKLRELVVAFMENRVGLEPAEGATLQERLARAQQELEARRPHLDALLTRLCKEYVEIKNVNPDKKYLRKLQIQIDNVDTQLLILEKTANVIVGTVYFYWRANMNSVNVAAQLGIRPPLVRKILHRLGKVWKNLQDPNHTKQPGGRDYGLHFSQSILYPGKKIGRLTLIKKPTEDLLLVDVVCKLEPRSLVRYYKGRGKLVETWVYNERLIHTRWQKAIMKIPPKFESWVCACACGRHVTLTRNALRHYAPSSCGGCIAT
jgi:hypothetical protein